MSKRKTRQSALGRVLAPVGLVLVGGYLAMGLVVNQVQISAKRQELAAVQAQLAGQQQQNDELKRVLESGSDLEIIERVARDSLGYAKPNERVFVDVTGK